MVATQAGWPSGTATAEAAHCGHHIGCSDVRHVCACRWAQQQQSSTGRLDSRVLDPQLVHYAGRVPDEWWGSQGRTSSGEFTFSSQLAAAKLLGGALILTGAGMPLAAEALAFQPQLKPLPRQPAGCCCGNVPAFAK